MINQARIEKPYILWVSRIKQARNHALIESHPLGNISEFHELGLQIREEVGGISHVLHLFQYEVPKEVR